MTSTSTITTQARTAAHRMRGVLSVAPRTSSLSGSESVYATAGNPIFGADTTGVTRVRDAKQAAPPRGELC